VTQTSSIHKFRRKDKYANRRCHCVSPVVTFSGKVKQISEGGPNQGCNEDLPIRDASEEVMACDMVIGCLHTLKHTEDGGTSCPRSFGT
jgi:uncharacterized protein (DUF362 family)